MKRHGNIKRKLSLGQIKHMRDLYRDGWNLEQLAQMYGVSRQAIWRLLKRRNEPMRPRHVRAPQENPNAARDELGIIVTLREQRSRELFSMHIPGKSAEALLYLAARLDRLPEDWRLLCYSTPRTILGDLQGRYARQGITYLNDLEARMLTQVGRIDLLDPELDHGWGSRRNGAQ
jgi:Homeodomain-like domain-containing protein